LQFTDDFFLVKLFQIAHRYNLVHPIR